MEKELKKEKLSRLLDSKDTEHLIVAIFKTVEIQTDKGSRTAFDCYVMGNHEKGNTREFVTQIEKMIPEIEKRSQ